MIAIGAFVFTIASRYLPVFSHPVEEEENVKEEKQKPVGELKPVYSKVSDSSHQ